MEAYAGSCSAGGAQRDNVAAAPAMMRCRGLGFWSDAAWADLHIERLCPACRPMVAELVTALPPSNGKRVRAPPSHKCVD